VTVWEDKTVLLSMDARPVLDSVVDGKWMEIRGGEIAEVPSGDGRCLGVNEPQTPPGIPDPAQTRRQE